MGSYTQIRVGVLNGHQPEAMSSEDKATVDRGELIFVVVRFPMAQLQFQVIIE